MTTPEQMLLVTIFSALDTSSYYYLMGVICKQIHVTFNESEFFILLGLEILDSVSTLSIVCYAEIADNIQDATVTTSVHTNNGCKDYTQTESLCLFLLPVHFNSTSLENILSLSDFDSHYLVTMGATVESEFNFLIQFSSFLIWSWTVLF